jgi:hypothetical protein
MRMSWDLPLPEKQPTLVGLQERTPVLHSMRGGCAQRLLGDIPELDLAAAGAHREAGGARAPGHAAHSVANMQLAQPGHLLCRHQGASRVAQYPAGGGGNWMVASAA